MNKTSYLFLKIALAFIFLYAGISAILNPKPWLGFVPAALNLFLSPNLFLSLHAIFEVALGVLFLTEWRQNLVAFLAAIDLAAIIAFNAPALNIIFRDVGLLLLALAYWKEVKQAHHLHK